VTAGRKAVAPTAAEGAAGARARVSRCCARRVRVVAGAFALCLAAATPCHAAHWHMPFHLRRLLRHDRWIEFRDHVHRPVPTAEDKRDGFVLFARNPLERVYLNSRPHPGERVGELHLQATWDEYEPVQLGVYTVRNLTDVTVRVSDLHDDAGHDIPASALTVRMVRYYGVQLTSRRRYLFGVVPKTLEIAAPLSVPRGTVRPYWITVHVPPVQLGGTYRGVVHVAHAKGGRDMPISVEVIPVRLVESDTLYGTLSINPLAQISHALARRRLIDGATVEEEIHLAHADALLARAELMLRDQRAHGMNTISLWSAKEYEQRAGHPYLSDVEVAMMLYRRVGFTKPMLYQMGTLLHTNKIDRAGNYRQFDPTRDLQASRDIARYYTARFASAGLPGIVFLPIEEPNAGDGLRGLDPPDTRQRIGRDLLQAIREAGGQTGITCTPESAELLGGLADYWIVSNRRFTPEVYQAAAKAGAKLGLYANSAMMGQNTYLPRFLFGYFAWANGLKAMLAWTYPVQPNRFPVNAGGRGEGGLNVRDKFLGLDGTPIPTVQWEMSREGIDDAKYLATIAALAGEEERSESPAAHAAVQAARAFLDEVHALVSPDARRYTFENPHTAEPQPDDGWDAARFEQLHARAGTILEQLLAAR
jgi:Glycoside hydrolase 123 N-terminal domain